MAADLIALAKRRRERLVTELARIDMFLTMAADLARNDADAATDRRTSRARPAAASRGVGADTVAVSLEIVREQGPQATRDLLPMLKARGIPVGGKSEIGTLSARLSTTGRGILEMREGKWHDAKQIEAPGPGTALEEGESTDTPTKDASADSLFHQTKEGRYAAALV